MTDIDIDFADPRAALSGVRHVAATTLEQGRRQAHISGVYFQDIPTDPLDGMAAWEYREAEQRGFFKIDFLSRPFYKNVRDEAHLVTLLTTEPPWDRLLEPAVVAKLDQIHSHSDIIQKIEPRSVPELAVCIALIRPGKRHLIKRPRFEILRDIWVPNPTDNYTFKRSHAIAYAALIVVQINLLVERGDI